MDCVNITILDHNTELHLNFVSSEVTSLILFNTFVSSSSVGDQLLRELLNLTSPLNPICNSGFSSLVFYRVETGNAAPIFDRVRRQAEDKLAFVKNEFYILVKADIIRRSKYSSSFCSCEGTRKEETLEDSWATNAIVSQTVILNTRSTESEKLYGAYFFNKVDLLKTNKKNSYHNDDVEKTAIINSFGLWSS